MSRAAGPAVGVALLALFLVALIEAGRVARHDVVAGICIAGGASLAGLAILAFDAGRQAGGRRRR